MLILETHCIDKINNNFKYKYLNLARRSCLFKQNMELNKLMT